MNKCLVLFTTVFLLGCAPGVEVTPSKLPDAYLNQPYEADIEIINSAVVGMSFYSEFSNSSFKLTPGVRDSGQDNYNNLKINGIATTLEPITIYMYGETYGTNFPGAGFEQEYTIEVKAHK